MGAGLAEGKGEEWVGDGWSGLWVAHCWQSVPLSIAKWNRWGRRGEEVEVSSFALSKAYMSAWLGMSSFWVSVLGSVLEYC